jgi:hypothetical protein
VGFHRPTELVVPILLADQIISRGACEHA